VAAERTQPLPGLVDLPPRSLRLRAPVWGVDPSTLRISVGIVGAGDGPPAVSWHTVSLPMKKHAHSAAGWYAGCLRVILPFLKELIAEHGVPAMVWVEEPFAHGKNKVHPSSNRMLGVLLAALGMLIGLDTVMELVGPMTWKALALGQGWGHAKPEQYLRWAQEHAGYTGTLEDEAAGIGIATAAGVKMTT
jgi:hypothetical protein